MNPPPDPNSLALKEMRASALHWLCEAHAERKAAGVTALRDSWNSGVISLDTNAVLSPQCPIPGHPDRPELVPPQRVKHRSMRTVEGRSALIHALAHIEFNAINLALDAIWRRLAITPQRKFSISFFAMKSAMLRSAIAGSVGYARHADSNRSPLTLNLQSATRRRHCAARSTWKRERQPVSAMRN